VGMQKRMRLLEWVPEGLNTGALSGAKASSSRTRDTSSILANLKVCERDACFFLFRKAAAPLMGPIK
jgi:hypothetical protein